ncbi:hypothetical protein KIW84_031284 [Lathyrus oleraceus]|uniref:H(+)-exporting diphosphatase n=1 Tax=Pisum sativum TaxID=3888 RepID=A0A9D5B0M2_PEA|nr:hypothetical protein KIW84_031284 [Pisum sativum]
MIYSMFYSDLQYVLQYVIERKANPKNVVSIILGGGSGVQLFPLTKRAATPAVPVGGCYRLIDIPMSNCINSGINKVFVLTQFNSASLNRHISRTYFGNGINFRDGYVELDSTPIYLHHLQFWRAESCQELAAILELHFLSEFCSPVQDVADSCRTGAATNVIFGLALGYKSVIIPIFSIAISIFVSFSFAAMYGVAVDALGMLSTIATGLAIDAYGPISDNAGGIAEMAGMSHRIRERTDALDAAGNTTAAIGKGFAIGSAALVSLALFGAFVSRAGVTTVDVLTPKVFIGLIVGAMLPYWFSAMTMKSVGSAALKMVEEVRRQFNTIPGLMEGTAKPDYATCVTISTDASIKEMIPPGALVMLTPLIVGIFFGVETLSGVLAGSLVSGVQIAISASNTGGAWDNAKKYIEVKYYFTK